MTMSRKRIVHHHGIAMMLVLFSVTIATILATAYLVSRDNSLAISRNSSAASRARWAALSGLETAVAILQTDTDWRANHTNGMLLDGYPLAGATVTATALDIETDQAPNPDSEYLRVLAMAEVDTNDDGTAEGRQSAVLLAYVPRVAEPHVAVDLAEFAIFVRDTMEMSSNSTVARWATAPLSKLGGRVNIGTHAQGSADIELNDNAVCVDCTVYHSIGASGTLVRNNGGPSISQIGLPFLIPFPASPDHGQADPSGGMPNLTLNSDTATKSSNDRYYTIVVENDSRWTLQGDITIVVDNDLRIRTDSTVIIDGNVTLVVFEDLEMNLGSIEVTPGSSLTFFNGDNATLTNAYIGELRSDNVRDNTGYEEYMDPLVIRVLTIEDTPHTVREWHLWGNSVMKASLYGETLKFVLHQNSALYGRMAGKRFALWGNGAFYYDPAHDERAGYTMPDSNLYEDDGSLVAAYFGGFTLDPDSLQALADTTGMVIIANGGTVAPLGGPPPPPDPPLGDPTPRPVPVESILVTFGSDMSLWEYPGSVEAGGGGGAGGGGTELFGDGSGGIDP